MPYEKAKGLLRLPVLSESRKWEFPIIRGTFFGGSL